MSNELYISTELEKKRLCLQNTIWWQVAKFEYN